MTDYWNPTGFEIYVGDDRGGMEIMADGSLEIHASSGTYEDRYGYERSHDATLSIPAERAPEILAGIQAWIDQLPTEVPHE